MYKIEFLVRQFNFNSGHIGISVEKLRFWVLCSLLLNVCMYVYELSSDRTFYLDKMDSARQMLLFMLRSNIFSLNWLL